MIASGCTGKRRLDDVILLCWNKGYVGNKISHFEMEEIRITASSEFGNYSLLRYG